MANVVSTHTHVNADAVENKTNKTTTCQPFPLGLLLQQEAPMRECILSSLSIDDLKALELVNRDARAAIRDRGYWKTAFSRLVKSDKISMEIYKRYIAKRADDDDSREGDEVGGDDNEGIENEGAQDEGEANVEEVNEEGENEGEENEGQAAGNRNRTDNERGVKADSRSHKRNCIKIEAIRRRLDENLRAGVNKESAVSFPASKIQIVHPRWKVGVFTRCEAFRHHLKRVDYLLQT